MLTKTDNWVNAFVEEDRFIRWYKGWFALCNGAHDAFMQWGKLHSMGKLELAEKARLKYEHLNRLEQEWPSWEEKYEFDWEAMRDGQHNNTK